MIYRNQNPASIAAMEADRTESFGDYYDEDIRECPICGALYPEKFFLNDDEECIGCDFCVHSVYELF